MTSWSRFGPDSDSGGSVSPCELRCERNSRSSHGVNTDDMCVVEERERVAGNSRFSDGRVRHFGGRSCVSLSLALAPLRRHSLRFVHIALEGRGDAVPASQAVPDSASVSHFGSLNKSPPDLTDSLSRVRARTAPDTVPPPGAYDVPAHSPLQPYKKAAMLERANRFTSDPNKPGPAAPPSLAFQVFSVKLTLHH